MTVSIYAICSAGEVRYVGKTVHSPGIRLSRHLSAARRNIGGPLMSWLRKCLATGRMPTVTVLEMIADDEWIEAEMRWIAHFRGIGARLLNQTAGGEGLSGHKFAGSSHAAKIAAALRTGSMFSCEECGLRFYRKRSAILSGDCRFCSRKCFADSLRGRPHPVSQSIREMGLAVRRQNPKPNCKRGHPLSGGNLYFTSIGARGCKECRKIHKATYRANQCDGMKKTPLMASA